MKKREKLFLMMFCGLSVFLLFMLYQHLKLTTGGFTGSSEVIATLPLVVQADVSLLAFWGFLLVFRITELASTRTELIKSLWEIGFKRDELKMKIAEDKENKELLMKLHEELGKDAKIRKEAVEAFYECETRIIFLGLLAVVFFVVSISSGIYGISMTFHTAQVDPFTYFTPSLCLFIGVILTIFALLLTAIRLDVELEIR